MMNENEEMIRQFIAAWSNLDAKQVAEYFAEDGVYHNMPYDSVEGKENIEKFISQFIQNWTETNWDIISILSSGNLVMVERLDRTKTRDKSVDLPCCGIFEMKDGKIKIWRDYFDGPTYFKAMSQ